MSDETDRPILRWDWDRKRYITVDETLARGTTKYAAALNKALPALSEVDPIGLLKMGCPDDEYMPEAEDIAARMVSVEVVDAAVVFDVLSHWFGYAFPSKAGVRAASALIAEELNR